jgi:hypothetical protein
MQRLSLPKTQSGILSEGITAKLRVVMIECVDFLLSAISSS